MSVANSAITPIAEFVVQTVASIAGLIIRADIDTVMVSTNGSVRSAAQRAPAGFAISPDLRQ